MIVSRPEVVKLPRIFCLHHCPLGCGLRGKSSYGFFGGPSALACHADQIKGRIFWFATGPAGVPVFWDFQKPLIFKWSGADLNRRHADFQSAALPTELPDLPLRAILLVG